MKHTSDSLAAALAFAAFAAACSTPIEIDDPDVPSDLVDAPGAPELPLPGARLVDHLIEDGEHHFEHLWMLTDAGENAEAYWSFSGDRLVMQHRNEREGVDCDRIFVLESDGSFRQVSDGRGTTTCAYFLPDDRSVLFASTSASHEGCPPKPDRSRGYVWPLYAEFDIYAHDLGSGEERLLIGGPGYDAEATVSPRGDRIVFTSTRSGDVELWTCALDGSDARQVTNRVGYDGGAFFSHDGSKLVYRTTAFTPGHEEAEQSAYQVLLADDLVRPSAMEIWVVGADGSHARQVTDLGGANWAPYFFPSDDRLAFSTNHHIPAQQRRGAPAFDVYAIDEDGSDLERITTFPGFDSFPMFSPDGRYMVFSSNRGGAEEGDTNIFVALWRD